MSATRILHRPGPTTPTLAKRVALVVLAGTLVACGAASQPDYAWPLDGNGDPAQGDVALSFAGEYELTDDAVSFDGASGYASTPDPGPVDATDSFSVAAWVAFARDPSPFQTAVSQLGKVAAAFYLGYSPGNWDFTMKTADSSESNTTVRAESSTPAVEVGRWVHLVGAYDASEHQIRLYVDGQAAASEDFTATWQADGPLTIGRSQSHSFPADFWPGAIAQVGVYAHALSDQEVTDLYASSEPSSPPPPLAAPDPSTYGNGQLNGTWDAVLPAGFLRTLEMTDLNRPDAQEVRIRLGFDDAQWWQGVVFDGELYLNDGDTEGDGGTFSIHDDLLTMISTGDTVGITYHWELDQGQLTLTVVEDCIDTPTCTQDRSQMNPVMIDVMEHTYTKSGNDPNY